MAIMLVMTWAGVSLEQYDETKRLVGWEDNPAKGGMLVVTAHDGNGLRMTEVWESAEAFEAFAHDRLMPVTAGLGLPGQPTVEIYPLHDMLVASRD